MNLTAIFIAVFSLVQPQAQLNKPTATPTCQSLSKEMDITLARRDLDSLEMDRELRQPRLQYIKMNCKNGKPTTTTDIILNTLFFNGVDAPKFNGINFGTGAATGVATETRFGQGQNENLCHSLLGTYKCEDDESLLGINAIDNIL